MSIKFASMSLDHVYEIDELPLDERTLRGQNHRRTFYRITQAAIWIAPLYFTARLYFLLRALSPTWKMWAMLGIECLFAHMSYQHQAVSLSAASSSSQASRKKLRLRNGTSLPTVDVLITCCGESVEIISDTVRAACSLDYPASLFRVRLLDDGASTELRDEITRLSMTWSHLSYHTRGKQSNQSFAKAGNLNYALFSLQTEDPPEYCTVVDADSILMPHFLRATLPHLLKDPEAALVTTRQYFDNLPRGDPLSQARAYFYTCENTELDLMGHAVDAGSGAVFRRKAILDVGGYPTFSFSEDWQLSLVLRGMGKRTMQVQEILQFGLVPTSFAGHLKQRNRWHIGHSQQVSVLFASAKNAIPQHLRWDIATGGLSIMAGLVTYVIGFFAIPTLFFVEGDLFPSRSLFEIKSQVVLAILHVSSTWAYNWSRSTHAGVPFMPLAHTENSWLAPAHLYAVVQFHLFGSKPKGSFVTGSAVNCRENASPVKLFPKIHKDVLESGLWLNLCLFTALLCGTLFSLQTLVGATGPLIPRVLSSIAWPPFFVMIISTFFNHWTPISHLLNPPVYPSRDSGLMVTESKVPYSSANIQADHIYRVSMFDRTFAFGLPIVLLGMLVGVLIL
ncbi:unnamed protein product [Penicillium salamii]|uniref:Glycosyltransferase 2-like domain-containing protein n=1 Tax=Penicillium salamii TaxID=1612424 RepID=A0A9W4IXZ7_9EURO|nr:unnamed protein product [Penicillium salamii]